MEKMTDFPARTTRPFKLKDKSGRGGMVFNLKEVFGFIPDLIVIQKVAGEHDKFVLSAVLTPAELAKEKKLKNISETLKTPIVKE